MIVLTIARVLRTSQRTLERVRLEEVRLGAKKSTSEVSNNTEESSGDSRTLLAIFSSPIVTENPRYEHKKKLKKNLDTFSLLKTLEKTQAGRR